MKNIQEPPIFMRELLHDLEHGLAAMNIILETMRQEPALSPPLRSKLTLLGDQLSYLGDVIEQSVTGSVDSIVDVRAVAERVVRLANARHAATVRLVAGPAVYAKADPTTLQRILANLVDNAAQATGSGGMVVVTISHDCAVLVAITDDGPGFDPAMVRDSSLGLRVVRDLLDFPPAALHLWSLPGGGTGVAVRFPAAQPRRALRPATARRRIR